MMLGARHHKTRAVLGLIAGLIVATTSTSWATAAIGAASDKTVTVQNLTFAVPRSWVVVPANRAPCTGARPIVLVGTYTSFAPTSCIAITDKPAQPTVTINTTPIPASALLHSDIKPVTRTSHGVHYSVTYGSQQTSHASGNSMKSWEMIARFTDSPVAFMATGGGAPGSAGFDASMKVLESVRPSK